MITTDHSCPDSQPDHSCPDFQPDQYWPRTWLDTIQEIYRLTGRDETGELRDLPDDNYTTKH